MWLRVGGMRTYVDSDMLRKWLPPDPLSDEEETTWH
jgi:hypothetical protein